MPGRRKSEPKTPSRAAVAPKKPKRRNAVIREAVAPSTPRGIRTRDKIKEAATTVLERIGYRAMRLQDIADEAGVNVSLLYRYFTGKPDITREILEDILEDRGRIARAPTEQRADPFDAIVQANEAIADVYSTTPGLMRCLLQLDEDEADFSSLYRRISLDWNRRVARDIARRFSSATLSDDERLMIAYALGGLVDDFLFEMYVDRNPLFPGVFQSSREVALFLAVIWYRALYLENPPEEKLGKFRGFVGLQLQQPS